jgi:hypothetical protein
VSNHPLLMIIFSALVSLVFTFLNKYGARERTRYFFYLFGSFVLISILFAWIVYPFSFMR